MFEDLTKQQCIAMLTAFDISARHAPDHPFLRGYDTIYTALQNRLESLTGCRFVFQLVIEESEHGRTA